MGGYAGLMMPPCMVWYGDVNLSAKTELADLVERQVGSARSGKTRSLRRGQSGCSCV